MTITNKATFNALSQRSKLGNYLRTWKDCCSAERSGCEWFTIQDTRPASPYFVAVVPRLGLQEQTAALLCQGQQLANVYYREIPPPDATRVFNGEASRSILPHYLYLKMGAVPTVENLRDDLKKNARVLTDVSATAFLYAVLGEELETLLELWTEYPDSIIEFTYWSKPMGVLNKRLLIWEVRDF